MDCRIWSFLHNDIDHAGSDHLHEEGVSVIRKILLVVFLLLAASINVMALGKAADAMKTFPRDENQAVVIPAPILKIAALEYRGLIADIYFIKSMVFIGETQLRNERPKVKEWEWQWWTKTLETAIDLDPYFFDPYYYANAFLPWDAHKTEEANRLLKKGSDYRAWDWMLPFFIGFNDFFFLQNDGEASEYLMEASRRPGGDPMLASIAARLAFRENRTETAIYFLEETAQKTENTSLKQHYEMRIKALRSILFLNNAVAVFKKKFGRTPTGIEELLKRNVISEVPRDPYGGMYYIAQDGEVRSTNSSELEPYLSPIQKKMRQ